MPLLRRAALPLVCAGLGLVVLLPLLGRGFVLSYDMVFAPRLSLLPSGIGLDSTQPRSVPSDAVVAIATWLIPGDILQKLLLAAALVAGPLGAGRLVPTESVWTRVIAAVAYGWSAYVAERLFIGHWQLLLAYACLPWIAAAGLDVRRSAPKSMVRLVLACVPAVLTPPGGIIAGVAAVVCAGARRFWLVTGAMLVLNAPWWVPAVLHSGAGLSTPDGVTAFAARAESWGSPVVSLLGLGGIWSSGVTPESRANPLVPLLILAMVGIALLGLRVLATRWGAPPARALMLLGVAGVTLAALGSIPVGADVMRWLTAHVPGAGLLRDGQRFVAWWALPLALGFALAVEAATGYLRRPASRRALLAAAAVFPIAVLPDLAFAGWGRLASVAYPADWAAVRQVLAADQRPGDVLAVPWSAFRRFAWNGDRVQLDPAPRVLPRPVVIDDTLVVSGHPLHGEDPRAAAARRAGPAELPALGFGWVLVEHGTPGPVDATLLSGLEVVYEGDWLTLYHLQGQVVAYPEGAPRGPVLAADLAALGLLAFCLLWRVLPAGKLSGSSRTTSEEQLCE
jgi:hypothetical protein